MTLTEFLLERIAEDEAEAHRRPEHYLDDLRLWESCPKALTEPLGDLEWGPDAPCRCGVEHWQPNPRELAECEAKRRIVTAHEGWHVCPNADGRGYTDWHDGGNGDDPVGELCPTLLVLAPIYSDHPDFREEWA